MRAPHNNYDLRDGYILLYTWLNSRWIKYYILIQHLSDWTTASDKQRVVVVETDILRWKCPEKMQLAANDGWWIFQKRNETPINPSGRHLLLLKHTTSFDKKNNKNKQTRQPGSSEDCPHSSNFRVSDKTITLVPVFKLVPLLSSRTWGEMSEKAISRD